MMETVSLKLFMWVVGGMGSAVLGLSFTVRWLITLLLESKSSEADMAYKIAPLADKLTMLLPRQQEIMERLIGILSSKNGGSKP